MNKYQYKFWAPLVNFESETSEIKLADDVIIRRASEYEKQIDQLVYKLYGLTKEEIKIIEQNKNI